MFGKSKTQAREVQMHEMSNPKLVDTKRRQPFTPKEIKELTNGYALYAIKEEGSGIYALYVQ